MNVITIIGLIIIGLIILAILWFITTYNKLVQLKALLEEAFSGIDVQLKRRYDLIPNLVQIVKQYSIHEKTVYENVTKLRAATAGAQGIEEKLQAEAGLTNALKTLFAVVENYPDLKANQNFIELQRDLNSIENEIQLSRRYYNGTARNYNTLVKSFPTNIIANITHFEPTPYFEISTLEERENPKIQF